MFEYTWKPDKVTLTMKDGSQSVWEPPFDGCIVLSAPRHVERIRYMHEIGLDISGGDIATTNEQSVSRIERMVEIAKKHIVKVELKKRDGFEFNCVDDLEYDSDGSSVLMHLAQKILQGFPLGECSRKS